MNKLIFIVVGLLCAACGGSAGGASSVRLDAGTSAAVPPPEQETIDPSALSQPSDDPVADAEDPSEGTGAGFELAGYAPPAPPGEQGPGSADTAPALESDATQGLAELALARQNDLYVSPSGSDKNNGTSGAPFRSITRAAKVARPGMKIFVAPGTYSGGFRTKADGNANARITYVSSTRWGARIVPPRNSPNKTAWDNRGSYVDIVGFEVDGSYYQGGKRWTLGIYNGGSYVSIRRNHVHHIAHANDCDRSGGAGIGVDSYYGGVKADVISNLLHDIGPAGCRFVQGVYVSTSGRVKNNVVYRVAEGAIHLWHDASDVIITNNTVTESNTGIVIGGGDFYHSSKGNDNTAVYSNIVYGNKMGISEQGKTGTNNTYRNNLVYNNSKYDWRLKNGLKHTGTVSAAPEFLASERSSEPNLKLSAASPAIGMATAEQAESTDFEGKPRNARAGYDIGAYQH